MSEIQGVGQVVLRDRAAARRVELARVEEDRRFVDEARDALLVLEQNLRAERQPRVEEKSPGSTPGLETRTMVPNEKPAVAVTFDPATLSTRVLPVAVGVSRPDRARVEPDPDARSPSVPETAVSSPKERVRSTLADTRARLATSLGRIGEMDVAMESATARDETRQARDARKGIQQRTKRRRDVLVEKIREIDGALAEISDAGVPDIARIKALRDSLVLKHSGDVHPKPLSAPTLQTRTRHHRPIKVEDHP